MSTTMTLFGSTTFRKTETVTTTTSTTMSGSAKDSFTAFVGGGNKLPPPKETPVEASMRRALVHKVVRHAFRCVEVQEQERKALVIQKYWRSYAANRELRRRRWAKRRARARAAAVAGVLGLPANVARAGVVAFAWFVWSFLTSFRLFRALVWFTVRLPRSLYRASYSWEGAVGVTASAMLAGANRHPDAVFLYNFQDFLTLYVVSFVLLDVFAPAVVRPALTAHASIRRGVKLSVRFVVLGVASRCERPKELEIHRLALRLGILDELPSRFRVLKPSASPPMVHPVPRSKDPELLKAVADAHQAAKESSRYADEAASQADELEEKLGALATSLEVHVMNKLEGKLRAISDMSEAQYEAAKELLKEHSGPRVAVNTNLVDERIDKRFEDMEQMLRSARDEGRAEGFKEVEALRRSSNDEDEDEDERLAFERSVREGVERGVAKGIEMEKERRRKKSLSYKVKAVLGMKGGKKEKAALEKRRLEELKGAIRSGQFPPVTQQHHM